VTVLTGLDNNRTLERLLSQQGDARITAIVPKRGRSKKKSSYAASVLPTTERLVRMGKGCACCTVRGDLMTKIQRIAAEKTADHIVIQATPHSDLVTLAKTFTVANEAGAVLSDVARLESIVMVVDARNLLSTLETPSARAMVERIELANVIVVEGLANGHKDTNAHVLAILNALNSEARITPGDTEDIGLSSLKGEQPFNLADAQRRASQVNEGTHASEETIRFTYHARRPFHPTRLHALIHNPLKGVLRAKGAFWVASRPNFVGEINIAGGSRNTSAGGMWWAAVPEERHPQSDAFREFIQEVWHPAFGDRVQEISIVGFDIDQAALTALLDTCLMTDQELEKPEGWQALPHPFPWPKDSA
jgi:G3E family GTPase